MAAKPSGCCRARSRFAGEERQATLEAEGVTVRTGARAERAGELVHTATTAIAGGVTLEQLWHAVPSFPTLSEVWLRLLEAERGG